MPPVELLYSQTHLWVSCEDDIVVLGVTEHGLDEYGDVVAVELPEPGAELIHDEHLGELECTQGVWELYAPVDGVVVEVNEPALRDPEQTNVDPYGEGWLLQVELKDRRQLDRLLTADEYETLAEKQTELEGEEDEDSESEFGFLEE
jgi:glycine cleavage system H protein